MATQPPSSPNPDSTPPSHISTDEIRDLIERKIAIDFLKYKKNEESKEPKPKWLQFFESAGFVTLVTVVIGGVFGTWITYYLQNKSKEREDARSQSQIVHDRKLAAFKEHLERERKLLDEMSVLLGGHMQAVVNLQALAEDDWNTKDNKRQRIAIRKQYNDTAQVWEGNRTRLGLQFQLENNNDPQLNEAWVQIGDRLDLFGQCAYRTQLKYKNLTRDQAVQKCDKYETSLEESIQSFTTTIISLNASAASASEQ